MIISDKAVKIVYGWLESLSRFGGFETANIESLKQKFEDWC